MFLAIMGVLSTANIIPFLDDLSQASTSFLIDNQPPGQPVDQGTLPFAGAPEIPNDQLNQGDALSPTTLPEPGDPFNVIYPANKAGVNNVPAATQNTPDSNNSLLPPNHQESNPSFDPSNPFISNANQAPDSLSGSDPFLADSNTPLNSVANILTGHSEKTKSLELGTHELILGTDCSTKGFTQSRKLRARQECKLKEEDEMPGEVPAQPPTAPTPTPVTVEEPVESSPAPKKGRGRICPIDYKTLCCELVGEFFILWWPKKCHKCEKHSPFLRE